MADTMPTMTQPAPAPSSTPTDLVRGLLARIDALEGLAVAHAHRIAVLESQRSKLSLVDREALARILPVIVGVFGSDAFLAAEVIHHESAGLRLVLKGWNTQRLGKLLKRATREPIDGLLVERHGEEAGAVLWKIGAVVPDLTASGSSGTSETPWRQR